MGLRLGDTGASLVSKNCWVVSRGEVTPGVEKTCSPGQACRGEVWQEVPGGETVDRAYLLVLSSSRTPCRALHVISLGTFVRPQEVGAAMSVRLSQERSQGLGRVGTPG